MATSFGPSGTVFFSFGAPVSSTHNRSSGSTTTDCALTKCVWSAGRSEKALGFGNERPGQLLISSFGYATALPFTTSATVNGIGSPQRAKFTKMRPVCDTVTPSGIGPGKVATVSRWPVG